MSKTIEQKKKIVNLFKDGQWHCINEVRNMYIFSFHKRRVELEGRENLSELPTGKYIFDERPCEHGTKNQKDFRMSINTRLYREVIYRIEDGRNVVKLEKYA